MKLNISGARTLKKYFYIHRGQTVVINKHEAYEINSLGGIYHII